MPLESLYSFNLFKFYLSFTWLYIYILNLQIYFQHQLSLPLPSRQIPSDYPCNGSFVTLFAIKHEVFLRHNVDHIYEKKEEFWNIWCENFKDNSKKIVGVNLIKRLTIRRFTSCHSNAQL